MSFSGIRESGRFLRILFGILLVVGLVLLPGCGKEEPAATTTEPVAESEPEAEAPSDTASDNAVELEFWQSVKDSEDADQLLAYIKKYPEGQFIELAETRLKGLSQPKATPEKTSKPSANSAPQDPKTRLLSVVKRSIGRYSNSRLHIHPDIPRFKADNAASVHGMDPRRILVLYDDGFRGGGKTGFAITDRRIYWRFVSGADPLYLEFRDIQSAIARKSKFLLNGYEVSTTMSDDPRHAAEVFADLAIDLRDAYRR